MLTIKELIILHQLKQQFKVDKLEVNYQNKQYIYQVSIKNKSILNDIQFNLIFEHHTNDNKIILNDLASTYQHNVNELGNFNIKKLNVLFLNVAFKADANFNDKNELTTEIYSKLFNKNSQNYFDKYVACLTTLNNYYLLNLDDANEK